MSLNKLLPNVNKTALKKITSQSGDTNTKKSEVITVFKRDQMKIKKEEYSAEKVDKSSNNDTSQYEFKDFSNIETLLTNETFVNITNFEENYKSEDSNEFNSFFKSNLKEQINSVDPLRFNALQKVENLEYFIDSLKKPVKSTSTNKHIAIQTKKDAKKQNKLLLCADIFKNNSSDESG